MFEQVRNKIHLSQQKHHSYSFAAQNITQLYLRVIRPLRPKQKRLSWSFGILMSVHKKFQSSGNKKWNIRKALHQSGKIPLQIKHLNIALWYKKFPASDYSELQKNFLLCKCLWKSYSLITIRISTHNCSDLWVLWWVFFLLKWYALH